RHRKVERGDDPAYAERVPGLHHPMSGPLGRDGEPVKLARETDSEIADVDHFLNFAKAFLENLPILQRDEAAELLLVLAQGLAETAHEFATARRGNGSPRRKRGSGAADRGADFRKRRVGHPCDLAPIDRRANDSATG